MDTTTPHWADDARIFIKAFNLTPQQANLLRALCMATEMPYSIPGDMYGVGGRALVHKLKVKLELFGVELHSSRDIGYFIEPEGKEKIKQIIAERV